MFEQKKINKKAGWQTSSRQTNNISKVSRREPTPQTRNTQPNVKNETTFTASHATLLFYEYDKNCGYARDTQTLQHGIVKFIPKRYLHKIIFTNCFFIDLINNGV